MDPAIQYALVERRPRIRSQWEKLLRLDHGVSALARPDTLVHLIDRTLDEVYTSLPLWSVRRHPTRAPEPLCPCGRSPFLAYFAAGRQAMHEGLVTLQAEMAGLTAAQRDDAFACLDQVFGRIARRDIESFCAVCQLHPETHRRDREVGPSRKPAPRPAGP
jgi:hypothetical protein